MIGEIGPEVRIGIIIAVIALFAMCSILVWASRYKKCPSGKIMVIYGKVGKNKYGKEVSAKCMHGGAAFIVPVVQSYAFLDLAPIPVEIDIKNVLSGKRERLDILAGFTVAISTEQGVMQNAAERLLLLKTSDISELAKDIILGQLRLAAAKVSAAEIDDERDKFLEVLALGVETEIRKIGLRIININIHDIVCK